MLEGKEKEVQRRIREINGKKEVGAERRKKGEKAKVREVNKGWNGQGTRRDAKKRILESEKEKKMKEG